MIKRAQGVLYQKAIANLAYHDFEKQTAVVIRATPEAETSSNRRDFSLSVQAAYELQHHLDVALRAANLVADLMEGK